MSPSSHRTMDTQVILFLLLIGLASGMLSGMIGVGGGIIIIPALIYLLGFSQKMAQGTSLGILLLPVGILAVWQYYKHGYVDVKAVGLVAAGFVAGGLLGSKLALAIPQDLLKKIFAIIMLILGLKMLLEKSKPAAEKATAVEAPANTNL